MYIIIINMSINQQFILIIMRKILIKNQQQSKNKEKERKKEKKQEKTAID